MTGNIGILATGCYLPERVVTNQELAARFKVTGSRADMFLGDSGVTERRVCGAHDTPWEMAARATLDAIGNAGLVPDDIDLILTGAIRDRPGNATDAARVKQRIGAANAVALEMETGCSSMVVQAILASGLVKGGMFKTVCCAFATSWTTFADYTSRDGWLLGDGAAAWVLGPVDSDRGILGAHLENMGHHWDAITLASCCPKGGSEQGERLLFRISDDEDAVAWYAATTPVLVPDLVRAAAARACMGLGEVDYFISHQPNGDVPRTWARALGFEGRHHVTVEKYGNMSGASAGVNLHEALRAGHIGAGDVVAVAAPGASTLHGAMIVRF